MCDMIHEVLGHGVACALTPGVRALSLSTVALQTSAQSRFVASAGSIANLAVGAVLLAVVDRMKRFGLTGYFLWLLATLNLLNGTGYLLFSSILNIGDWAVVIEGARPHWVWRTVMGVVGIAAYARSVQLSANLLGGFVRSGQLAMANVRRLVILAYLSGGLLLVAGAARNSISQSLVLTSGVSSGFGAMMGLLFIPGIVEGTAGGSAPGAPGMRFSLRWALAGVLVAVFFIGVLGPGIRLARP